MKRLAIIAHQFPPMGGATYIRMVKFSRYLPQFGWRPTVITAGAGFAIKSDTSLLDQLPPEVRIVRTSTPPVPNAPHAPTLPFLRGKPRRMARAILEATDRAWIPDKAVRWNRRAIAEFEREHSTEPFQAILTTSPPHSTHLIGLELRRRHHVPWVVDFRDGWSGNPLYDWRLPPFRRMVRGLQDRVLAHADAVIATTAPIMGTLGNPKHGRVVANGFDPADLAGLKPMQLRGPSIVHCGSLNEIRSPDPFLRGFARFKATNAAPVHAHFFGPFPDGSRELLKRLGLEDSVILHPSVSHREALAAQLAADVLLLIQSKEIGGDTAIPGKLYEYLAARRPILVVASSGPAATLVGSLNAGLVADPDRPDQVAQALVSLLSDDGISGALQTMDLSKFDRRAQAHELARILDQVGGDRLDGQ